MKTGSLSPSRKEVVFFFGHLEKIIMLIDPGHYLHSQMKTSWFVNETSREKRAYVT